MKKAKFFLTAITVLTLVGGALAFNAARTAQNVFCPTTDSGGDPTCTKVAWRTNNPGGTSTTDPCNASDDKYYTTTSNSCTTGGVTGTVYQQTIE